MNQANPKQADETARRQTTGGDDRSKGDGTSKGGGDDQS
jgi:hypothetical protein